MMIVSCVRVSIISLASVIHHPSYPVGMVITSGLSHWSRINHSSMQTVELILSCWCQLTPSQEHSTTHTHCGNIFKSKFWFLSGLLQVDLIQESPADAGIPARRKNDEKNSSISKL